MKKHITASVMIFGLAGGRKCCVSGVKGGVIGECGPRHLSGLSVWRAVCQA